MRLHFIVSCFIFGAVCANSQNETLITDPFEEDPDLRFAADTFCREYTLANPRGKIALPYKPDCHYWWQCTAVQLKKHECQGSYQKITLHYDLYLDRCDEPETAKCQFLFDEETIVMDHIMKFYKNTPEKN